MLTSSPNQPGAPAGAAQRTCPRFSGPGRNANSSIVPPSASAAMACADSCRNVTPTKNSAGASASCGTNSTSVRGSALIQAALPTGGAGTVAGALTRLKDSAELSRFVRTPGGEGESEFVFVFVFVFVGGSRGRVRFAYAPT